MADKPKEFKEDRWGFPSTAWSVVIDAKDRTTNDYKEKLGFLISMYWEPVYRIVRLSWNQTEEAAKDLTQEFFTTFLEKNFLKDVSPDKGKFRTFVKVALKHFLLNEKERRATTKRGGSSAKVSIDALHDAPADGRSDTDPVGSFDKEWAKTVIQRSIQTLKQRLESKRKGVYWAIFEMFDLGTEEGRTYSYKEISDKLSVSEIDIKNHLNYTRKLLKRIITSEVSNYVLSLKDVEEELNYLLSIRL